MTRTSHALATGESFWLVDPVDWPEAIERASLLGPPAGVIQLLDRHNRDCADIAERLGVPLLVVPDSRPGTPFEVVEISDLGKVALIGAGMRSHPAVTARMFRTLADERINLRMISTSPITISCLIPRDDLQRAVAALRTAFALDSA